MKKIYLALLMALATTLTFAQNSAVSGCKNTTDGTVTIDFDYSKNCPSLGTGLAGMNEIGFHSGANQWSSVVDWNAANAETAANNGSDIFSVTVEVAAYYGVALDMLDNIFFVFNQGPSDPANPWSVEGKEDNGAGGCADFSVVIGDLPACALVSTIDVELVNGLSVSPNPFNDFTVIRFSNPNNSAYDITLTSLTGQVVKTYNNFTGNTLEVARDGMQAGMYFVTFVSENGKVATTKVAVR